MNDDNGSERGDNLGEEILIRDHVQVTDSVGLGFDGRHGYSHQSKHRGGGSFHGHGARSAHGGGHGHTSNYYQQSHGFGHKARSGGHSRNRKRSTRPIDISDPESEHYPENRAFIATGPHRTFATSDWRQVDLQNHYDLSPQGIHFNQGTNSYRIQTDIGTGLGTELAYSQKYSAQPMASSIHEIKRD